ncbi:ankyrin repeat-containing domain protein [Trichoderma velutinum]
MNNEGLRKATKRRDTYAGTLCEYQRLYFWTPCPHTPRRSKYLQVLEKYSDAPSGSVQVQLEEKEKIECRRSLSFREIDTRLQNVSPVQPGTCEWVFEMSLFREWYNRIENNNGLLWIKGNPGTGKSTLMKHIFEYCQTKKDYAIAAYFFNARGAELEQTPLGMLRSLLFQMLKHEPCLYDQLLPIFRKKRQEYILDEWEWSEPELKSFLLSEIPKCQSGPLLLIIDALDECNERDVQNVAEFLQVLSDNATDAGLTLNICLSSRHFPFIRFKKYQELILEKEQQHDEDIIKYISSNLTKKDEEIEEAIRKRSAGIFMWVVLVIRILNKAYEDGRVESMKDMLDEIPSELGDVFAMLLDRKNPNKDETILILQCVLFAKRPLTPEELYFAIIAGTKSQALGIWNPLQITPDIIRRRIISSSRGLVEIRRGEIETSEGDDMSEGDETSKGENDTVQFIHESVNDFLVRNRRLQRLDPGLMPNPIAKSHDRLKDCCMSYLMMESLELQNVEGIESNFPFLKYASRYLFDHAEEATSVGQTELLRTLEDDTVLKRVERFHSYFVDYGQNGASLNLLQILAARELPKLVVILLDRGAHINAKGLPSGTALEAAIEFGSEETVKTLLSKGAKIDPRRRYFGDTMLNRAFMKGNKVILDMLIEKRAKLSIWETIVQGGVFHHAVHSGNKDIVAMELDKGANINSRGLLASPLGTAALEGEVEIMEMLLEKGANINSRGLLGSPLGIAASEGEVEVVKMLLEKGANINSRGLLGSPLGMAVSEGEIEIVKMLLEKGANINSRGLLVSPLEMAVSEGEIEIVKMLLEKGANINSRGLLGSPLRIAVSEGAVEIVKMLLEKGANINSRGLLGSPLEIAVSEGAVEIVKMLLEKGANINSRGLLVSPLEWAVSHGETEIMKMLLEKGANINSRGLFGTPLQLAASEGYKEIVEVLLNKGAKINARGGLFSNALQGAAMNGHKEVVEMLLARGANINARGFIGPGYLLSESGNGRMAIQEMLLRKGTKKRVWWKVYGTALQAATVRGHEEIVQLLLDKGAKI